jgi:hypothetical protein
MRNDEQNEFQELLTDVLAFHGRDVTMFVLDVWWQACQPFSMEQVRKAFTAHTMDPERGAFPPKPADMVRVLQGTRADRSLVAWGKVLDAMQRVGAYESVAFDEGLIHAAVEDIGGWVAICRGELKDLPHVERRFCDSYRAYATRGDIPFPSVLPGVHQLQNATAGKASAPPMLIGDPAKAQEVRRVGIAGPKTRITPALASASDLLRIGSEA